MIGVDSCECIVLEDSPAGINAGYRAGAKVIAVPDMIPLNNEVLSKVSFCVGSLEIVRDIIEMYKETY